MKLRVPVRGRACESADKISITPFKMHHFRRWDYLRFLSACRSRLVSAILVAVLGKRKQSRNRKIAQKSQRAGDVAERNPPMVGGLRSTFVLRSLWMRFAISRLRL